MVYAPLKPFAVPWCLAFKDSFYTIIPHCYTASLRVYRHWSSDIMRIIFWESGWNTTTRGAKIWNITQGRRMLRKIYKFDLSNLLFSSYSSCYKTTGCFYSLCQILWLVIESQVLQVASLSWLSGTLANVLNLWFLAWLFEQF